MAISFRKGGRKGTSPTAESELPAHLVPTGRIQTAAARFRERLQSMNQAELKEFFHESWGNLSELYRVMGGVKWANQHHGEEISQLNSEMLNLYQSYQMMDDVVRGEITTELAWPYTPLPVGRISYVEWILFCMQEVRLEHYPE